MKPLSISKLAEIIKAQTISGGTRTINSVSIDSRMVKEGGVFFAVKGANHDGHDFVSQAFENGAVCAVVQNKIYGERSRTISIADDKPVLLVDDTIKALGELAKFIRSNSSCKVVAVTGSVGKTTTKNILNHILSSKYNCFPAPKSFNNNIGVPLTVFDAPDDCEFIIAELGSNHPGEIEYLSHIIQPDVAVITTVCPAHLEGFGSIEGIIKEKVSITAGLKRGGKFFINSDKKESAGGWLTPLVNYCKSQNLTFETFGTTKNCDVQVKDIELFGDKSTFVVYGERGRTVENVTVNLPLAGRANVENAAAAWAVCKYLGITAKQFARSIADIKPVGMRLEVIEFGSVTVINDCYNANPGSMENALETLSLLAGQRGKRPVFVFGRMGELGAESERLHTELGQRIVHYKIPLVLTTKGDSALAAQMADKNADFNICVKVFDNVAQLADNLHKFIQPDDIILVKASRSEHFEAVVERLKIDFNGI
ncbi:MAG: UDP-N-acetylmuramoyl-tripeptide--D-alanyl-D-alanine ligase [Phycisphaerae bacterium]|nr:UDP-N-acetylmuramoyl-tripeptide--D-alanyl-D-alanine ligase [Phycisphaerae bacterium]